MTTGQVIVAGSGASGLVAALAAAAGGADVLVLERSELLGGTTALGGGRVWVPANHCPENAGDSAEAARSYLGGLFPARYAHLTEAFVANAPAMARFVEERSPHRFAACPAYPDYHPERAGATAGGRCLDMELADLSAMAPQARQVRVPPGYLPMTQAEWEGWRFPCRFDWKLLRQREAAGLRANGVALAAAPGNTGDALRIARALGAATDNLGEGWWMPMMAVPGEEVEGTPYPRLLIRERAVPRQIMVNAAGRRFVNEASPYNEVGKAMHRADDGGCQNDPAFLIFDEEFTRRYSLPGFSSGAVPAWLPRAESPAAPAHRAAVLRRPGAGRDHRHQGRPRDRRYRHGAHRGGRAGPRPVRGGQRRRVLDRRRVPGAGSHPGHRHDDGLHRGPPRRRHPGITAPY